MSVTKQEIAENIEKLTQLIDQENERADEIFRTKVLNQVKQPDGTFKSNIGKTPTGNWKHYMNAGFSSEDEKSGDVGPFPKIREYAKQIKDWQAKDPEIAKAEKKRKLQEQLAALEAEDADVTE